MTAHFDAIIVGAGQAGPPLAGRLTAAGQRVAMVERKLIGGTCVNTGCIPTKTLVASAHAAHLARRGAEYGVGTGPISVDMAKVKARKDDIMLDDRKGVEDWLDGMDGCTVIRGHARFEDPHTLRVGDERAAAPTGSSSTSVAVRWCPTFPGLADVDFLTNVSILELDTLPEHLVIVGGSYIALEFAQMYRRFGARVTVVERGPRLASREDEDVSAAIRDDPGELKGSTSSSAPTMFGSAKRDNGFELTPRAGAAPIARQSSAAGGRAAAQHRRPRARARPACSTDARGYIVVDDQLKTNVDHIWAMGDCNGKGAFTHTSYNDFEIVAANLLDDDPRRVSDRITAYALYIDPPLGRAGMTVEPGSRVGPQGAGR